MAKTDNVTVTRQGAASPTGSNAVYLTPREWLIAAVLLLAFGALAPRLWLRVETFAPGPDYRIPYALGEDYWLYERCAAQAAANEHIAVIGDSVIWGHYVSPDQTLSHHLNRLAGAERFANLGLDGAHPAVLRGLVKHYAPALSNRRVLLHFNPLWITSEKHDLQTDKEFHFNHPDLVAQFVPRIPCYRASLSKRLWAVTARHVSFFAWTSHLKTTYFVGMDLPAWTIEHPYGNPVAPITAGLPQPQRTAQQSPAPQADRASRIDVAWVELDTSLQWRFFRQTVDSLRARGNELFVLVGPFNEHVLYAEDATMFVQIRSRIARWLTDNDVPHCVLAALPAALYADTSHPLSEGYAALAAELLGRNDFASFAEGISR